MSLFYRNRYRLGANTQLGASHPDPIRAKYFVQDDHDWLRVEMHINCNWHRPPVGMRADEASHEYPVHESWGNGPMPR